MAIFSALTENSLSLSPRSSSTFAITATLTTIHHHDQSSISHRCVPSRPRVLALSIHLSISLSTPSCSRSMATALVPTGVAPAVPSSPAPSPLADPDDSDPVGHEFIAKYRESLSLNGFKPNDINESALRRRRIIPTQGPRLVLISGPNVPSDNDHEQTQCFRDVVAARTISTYPLRADRSGTREGDPICDRYGFSLYHNRYARDEDGSILRSRARSLSLSPSKHQPSFSDVPPSTLIAP